MRNLLDEKPTDELRGRLAFSRDFVGPDACAVRDILDIGCGYGWFEQFALANGATSIVGIEPTEEALVTARAWLRDDRATFQVAGATSVPFPADAFDLAVMWEVLEHLPKHSEPAAFAEVARVLRPGGRLFLSTPHAAPLAVVTDPARWLIGHRHYTLEQVREFAARAGFEVVRLELHGGAWEIVHMNVLYVSKWILRRRPIFEEPLKARLDREWLTGRGFTNVFLECRKRE